MVSTVLKAKTPTYSNLDHALVYYDMGFNIIPLWESHFADECRPDGQGNLPHLCPHPEIQSGSKHPRLKYAQYKAERASREQVVEWWTQWPHAGIAVITGETSAPEGWSLVALDWDEAKYFAKYMKGPTELYPQTLMNVTRRGYHVFYYVKGHVDHAQYPDIHLDLQADGWLITVPPSINPKSGEPYYWYQGSLDNLTPIAYVDDIYELLATGGFEPPESTSATSLALRTRGETWVTDLLANPVREGDRNNAAASLAGYFAATISSDDIALAQLQIWNKTNCVPPLPEEVIEQMYVRMSEKEYEKKKSKLVVSKRNFGLERVSDIVTRLGPTIVDKFKNGHTPTGLQTSWKRFNREIGGFEDGYLYCLAGRPGGYKTAIAIEWAKDVAGNISQDGKEAVVIVSLEQGKSALVTRWIQPDAGVTLYELRKQQRGATPEELVGIQAGFADLAKYPIWIDSTPGLSIRRIEECLEAMEEQGTRVRFLVVDYINLLTAEEGEGGSLYQQVTNFINRLGGLTRTLDIPILVTAQLNREAEKDTEPRLPHLKESGAIEARSDFVIMSQKTRWEEDGLDHPEEGRIFIRKVKEGPVDIEIPFEVVGKGRKIQEKSGRGNTNAVPKKLSKVRRNDD